MHVSYVNQIEQWTEKRHLISQLKYSSFVKYVRLLKKNRSNTFNCQVWQVIENGIDYLSIWSGLSNKIDTSIS